MRRLLVDPLGPQVELAVFDGLDEIGHAADDHADKPVALEAAYRALAPTKLDEVILLNGPGNFTSLRVALGFVRGLALGFDIPSRGIGVFESDYALMQEPPQDARLYRDARGKRFYEAHFEGGQLRQIKLVHEIAEGGYSAEALEGTTAIHGSARERLYALAKLAEDGAGQTPAHAEYVRPPDAALPSEPPLVILDA